MNTSYFIEIKFHIHCPITSRFWRKTLLSANMKRLRLSEQQRVKLRGPSHVIHGLGLLLKIVSFFHSRGSNKISWTWNTLYYTTNPAIFLDAEEFDADTNSLARYEGINHLQPKHGCTIFHHHCVFYVCSLIAREWLYRFAPNMACLFFLRPARHCIRTKTPWKESWVRFRSKIKHERRMKPRPNQYVSNKRLQKQGAEPLKKYIGFDSQHRFLKLA